GVMQGGGRPAAGLAGAEPASPATAGTPDPAIFTHIGVQPFINCTATLTINGGSLMLPEVISAMEQAAHFHVRIDELMEKAGERLAELLQVEWGLITSGAAAALTHATAGCLAGAGPPEIPPPPHP